MLPVAHGLFAATCVTAIRGSDPKQNSSTQLWFAALLGISPDFDYAIDFARIFGQGWHHTFTHSLLFGCLAGLVIALCLRPFRWKSALIYGVAILSHPLLDYCFTESRGIELLWPFTATRYRLQIPNPIDYDWNNWSFSAAVSDLLKISFYELMIFGPVFLLVLWLMQRRPQAVGSEV